MKNSVPVRYVTDGRDRGRLGNQDPRRLRPGGVARQVLQLNRLGRQEKLDVLHVHGFEGTARLAGLVRLSGSKVPVIMTLFGPLGHKAWRPLYRRVQTYVTATQYVVSSCRELGIAAHQLRHGLVRDHMQDLPTDREANTRSRVIFWREASHAAGADVWVRAVRQLAPRYPEVSFDFAVRSFRNEVAGLDGLASALPNVAVHRFPYEDGVSIAQLLSESICAVLPFRELSIHPQLAILETLAMGVPVITTDIGSTREVVREGSSLLIPTLTSESLYRTVSDFLDNTETWKEAADDAAAVTKQWNWSGYVESLAELYEQATRAPSVRRAGSTQPSVSAENDQR